MSEQNNPDNSPPKSEHEISDFYDGMKKVEMEGYEAGIKKARTALFVTAALVFAGEMISASVAGIPFTPLLIGIAVVEAAIFVALGFWTKTKPLAAIITGLILFILMWVAAIAINGGRAAYSGVVVRVIIIVYLISAIKPARAWEETKKRL